MSLLRGLQVNTGIQLLRGNTGRYRHPPGNTGGVIKEFRLVPPGMTGGTYRYTQKLDSGGGYPIQ